MIISNDEANRSADDCRSQESWKHHSQEGGTHAMGGGTRVSQGAEE